MFSFAYTVNLFLLFLIPIFIALYLWSRYTRKKKIKMFGGNKVLMTLMPELSVYKPPIKITLQLIALAMLILAICRPWGGLKDEVTKKEGIEIVIAMDASNSMLAPVGSENDGSQRMRTAKLMLEKLINRLDNDRVGLIAYAGDAHTLIPISSDYLSAKAFLNTIDPAQISNQGTNITEAISRAMESFSDKKGVGRSIILITDAEELEDEDAVKNAVKNAAKAGIQTNVIGVGSSTPVTIPLSGGSYFTDESGQIVKTALNEELAASIAKAGNGIYVNASNSDALNELQKQLDTLGKTVLEANVFALHEELFSIFAWIALAFLIVDIFVLDRKISWLDKITFFKKEEKK
jgi:Ca-activated chloride channel family protein